MEKFKLLFVTLCYLTVCDGVFENISLGVLIDVDDIQSVIPVRTSIYANNLIHQYIHYNLDYSVSTDDSFEFSKTVCSVAESKRGVAGFISSITSENAYMIQSICSKLEIPLVQLLWDSEPSILSITSLNFYPDVDLFAQGLATIVETLQWKSFVILYEDETSLLKLQYVLRLEPYNTEKKWNNIKLKELGPGPDYRRVLKDIKHIPETNIILDCRTEKILDILEQAYSIRMLEIFHSYFLTSLDSHTVNLTSLNYRANITTIRIFEPESKLMKQAIRNWELTKRNRLKIETKYDPYEIKTSTVLMQDAVDHLIDAINDLYMTGLIETVPLRCNESEKFLSGLGIISYMKVKPAVRALTGPIRFSNNGTRIDFNIYLIKGTGNHTLNRWRAQDQHLISNRTQKEYEKDYEEMLRGERLTIASRIIVPYLSYKEGNAKLFGNARYEGYVMDLVDAISKRAGFEYDVQVVPDNQLGTFNKILGQWDGLMGEITEHRAHLAVGDLAMTAQRQKVVDFSSPFMNLGIGLMVKKPIVKDIPLFSFLAPFTPDVWVYTGTLVLALSILFFLAYRLAPNEWMNPHPCEQNPDELEIEWSFKNCVWLILGSLLQQGCDILPRSLSTRVSLALWWFFSLIMYNSYTANLAAFLTTEKAGVTVKSVEELAKQTIIKYGCKDHGATFDFFKNSDYTTYRKMWNDMISSNNPTAFVSSDAEGVNRVLASKDSLYAYMTESTIIDYEVKTRCELKSVGSWLNSISYAIAMPMNAGYLGIINSAILNLSESGELDKLKEKWWKHKRKEPICKEEPVTGSDKSLHLDRVAGVFLVTGIGIAVGHLIGILEFLWNVKSIAVEEKMSYCEALKNEFKFAVNLKLKKKRTKYKIKQNEQVDELFKGEKNRSKSRSGLNLNKIHAQNNVTKHE